LASGVTQSSYNEKRNKFRRKVLKGFPWDEKFVLTGLSAVFLADWRGVLGKSGCWARNATQSLSVTATKPFTCCLKES